MILLSYSRKISSISVCSTYSVQIHSCNDFSLRNSFCHAFFYLILSSFKLKVKVKLSLCLPKYHAMETYWGRCGIALRIKFGTRWR
jgi:hypothetical protein